MNEQYLKKKALTLEYVQLTVEEFKTVNWLEAVNDYNHDEIESYAPLLFNSASEAAARGKEIESQVFIFLASVASMSLCVSSTSEPLKPRYVPGQNRYASLSDFSEHHIQLVASIYEDTIDPEMKARLADILWIRRKDGRAARVAAQTYLDRAKDLFNRGGMFDGYSRLRRAVEISFSLGKGEERSKAEEFLLEQLEKPISSEADDSKMPLFRLALECKLSKYDRFYKCAEASAIEAENRQDWARAGEYWGFAWSCQVRANNNVGAKKALLRKGEAFIALGEAMAGSPGLAAEHWLEQGLLALRQAGAPKAQREEVHRRLNELQRVRLEHFGRIEYDVPIKPELLHHLDRAKGLSFGKALAFWSVQVKPISKERLSEIVIKNAREFPTATMFDSSLFREDGKVVIKIPGLPLNGEPSEELLQMHMWRKAELARPIRAWMAEQVRETIAGEHIWTEGCLDWLLNDNSFVPKGREPFYERGIRAGIEGDYMVAAHLLVPQLENSFRSVLNQHGVITTSLGERGSQDEWSLNKIVENEMFEQVFGVDMAFELRGLLVEKSGANLRNNLFHGLLSSDELYSWQSIIIPPLTILLLLHGLRQDYQSGSEAGVKSVSDVAKDYGAVCNPEPQ